MTAKEELAKKVSDAVGAGKAVAVETVDFSDPNRPKTCLEVDFPILPINQIAAIEGNAGKPIYQMSKWWARRRSSVFRSMLLAGAMKAPKDEGQADKAVWDVYYANHQKKGALKHLKVADIFMGGGTTIVEGSRLGMQMYGNDLNPVAWFIVKNELAQVDRKEVAAALAEVEREVKPQIMPLYACDCPRGHKGTWTRLSTADVMGAGFEPLAVAPEDRGDFQYGRWRTNGGELLPLDFDPERLSEKERATVYFDAIQLVYTFWSKHGPCKVTACGHRTPIRADPVLAVKTISVSSWSFTCDSCDHEFDVEDAEARMAPGVPLVLAPDERSYSVLGRSGGVTCPDCAHEHGLTGLSGRKSKSKKVELTLLIHPDWLAGSSPRGPDGSAYGGSFTSSVRESSGWYRDRSRAVKLIEVRGRLPETVADPETGATIHTGSKGGTVPKNSTFTCGACGTAQRVLEAVSASKVSAPLAPMVIQGHCPRCAAEQHHYNGRFFASPAGCVEAIIAAEREWDERRDADLAPWWPRSELPFGHMTHERQPLPAHGFRKWSDMFNARQLLLHSQLLRSIAKARGGRPAAADLVLGAFQQYLQAQTMLCWWNIQTDRLAVAFSNNNFHPKSTLIEGGYPWADFGHSRWASCTRKIGESLDWLKNPWETGSVEALRQQLPSVAEQLKGKGEKIETGDPPQPAARLAVASSTEPTGIATGSIDLVITDPPFGNLLHYSELSDFFYVWLRLALRAVYPEFNPPHSPKTLEVVSNPARNPDDADAFYKRLLTEAWREAHRLLKPGGTLAFTFHHNEDDAWVDVLESLFEAGFYLEATYPIRSDETKGDGDFGSRKVEYDIIHVCRKRLVDPTPVSWAKLRRKILQEAAHFEALMEHHRKAGVPDADIALVRRGKALEHFSRHFGKVFLEEGEEMRVVSAIAGIIQVLEQGAGGLVDPPPSNAIPFTWQFCRMFDQRRQLPRDQMQKYLRGTGYSTEEYEQAGLVYEDEKVFHMVDPKGFAQSWVGRHRLALRGDFEQTMFLIGASFEGSGINVSETLANENFMPHPALAGLLEWFGRRGGDAQIRSAAIRARQLYAAWQAKNQDKERQLSLFRDEGDSA